MLRVGSNDPCGLVSCTRYGDVDEVLEALAPAGVEQVVWVPQAGAHILSVKRALEESAGPGLCHLNDLLEIQNIIIASGVSFLADSGSNRQWLVPYAQILLEISKMLCSVAVSAYHCQIQRKENMQICSDTLVLLNDQGRHKRYIIKDRHKRYIEHL